MGFSRPMDRPVDLPMILSDFPFNLRSPSDLDPAGDHGSGNVSKNYRL